MPSHHHSHRRQAPTQFQPAPSKQFDDHPQGGPRDARRRGMSQHALDLRMLQEQIGSPARYESSAGQEQLRNDGRIAIGSVQTDQRHCWWEGEVLQIGRAGSQCRSQLTAIVASALTRIRADPLARVHLQRRGACADHFPTFASSLARRTDRIESAFGHWQLRTAGERTLPRRRARGIHVKDNVAPTQATRRGRQWFPRSTLRRNSAARASARKASKQGRSTSARKRLQLDRWGKHRRSNRAMKAISNAATRSKKSARVRSPLMASPTSGPRKSMAS